MIKETIEILSKNKDLTAGEMQKVMEEILTGKADTSLIVAFLTALNKKGESTEELTAAVKTMRRYATKIRTDKKIVLDTCGTGGDKKGTFNISTITAFVAAGCGITVAKHGNRSVSSKCGSADILEAVGIKIDLSPRKIERCLNEAGVAFLFAPNLHPAMKYAMPARKQMAVKTLFNLLGPLSNPAGATHQLVGVYDKRWTQTLAQVLGNLSAAHVLVVHGHDGLDEITTTDNTSLSEFYQGKLRNYEIIPEDFGFKRVKIQELLGADAAFNAQILIDVLNGKTGPCRDIVVLNSAAAIYVADKAKSLREGIKMAQESIDSKRALEKLELLKNLSNQL